MKKLVLILLIIVFGLMLANFANAQTISERLKGRLLLQVEQGGSIWYVDTKEFKRYSVTWANALPLFVKLSLGITDANLAKIPIYGSGQTGNQTLRNNFDKTSDGRIKGVYPARQLLFLAGYYVYYKIKYLLMNRTF